MSLEAEINFCLNFLKVLDRKKSSVYSPASLLNALALLYIGSSGETAKELSKVIGREDQSKAAIIEYYSKLFKGHKLDEPDVTDIYNPPPEKKFKKEDEQELKAENSKDGKNEIDKLENDGDSEEKEDDDNDEEDEYCSSEEEDITPSSKLIIANRLFLFVNEKIKVKKAFEELLKEKFYETIEKIDFNDEAAEKIINEYVKKTTHGMIKEIIKSGDISAQTSVILINAIYFIGKWENTFPFKFKEKFYISETKIREMQFMKIGPLLHFYFNEGENWKSIGIPYRERHCWMFIILPKKKNDLENLIKSMDYSLFLEATKGTESGYIQLTMPMFGISESYDLQENLTQLGLNHLFNNCNISEMLNGPHKIDKAIHKAMIQVDEYGTVASAVSASTIAFMSAPNNVKIFTADHPFLYFLVSMKDHTLTEILFAGKFS